jgi:hypothetical protein
MSNRGNANPAQAVHDLNCQIALNVRDQSIATAMATVRGAARDASIASANATYLATVAASRAVLKATPMVNSDAAEGRASDH